MTNSDKKQKNNKEIKNYMAEGLSIGMCFGLSIGMLLGVCIGSLIKKQDK